MVTVVSVSEDHQCRLVKWTEARAAKCFLADELDTNMDLKPESGQACEKLKVRRKLQLYIPKPNAPTKDSKRRQTNSLHTLDKCDPLGLGLMWDTCFLRLMDTSVPNPIPLTRELLAEALSGLCPSQAVEHDLFQDAAVMCDVPSQNDTTDNPASDDEQLTIKSLVEEVDVGDDNDDDDDCDTGDEASDQDDEQDDDDAEFEEDVEEL